MTPQPVVLAKSPGSAGRSSPPTSKTPMEIAVPPHINHWDAEFGSKGGPKAGPNFHFDSDFDREPGPKPWLEAIHG